MEIKSKKEISNKNYQSLKKEIGELLVKGREQAGRAVNTILVLYFKVK